MLNIISVMIAALMLLGGAQAAEPRLALSGEVLGPSGQAARRPLVTPVAGRPLSQAVYDAANEIFLDFQIKCGGKLPDIVAFVGAPEHEPRISERLRRVLNGELLRSAGGKLVRPTEMSTLKLLAPFLSLDAKGQEEMNKAEAKINGSPIAVLTEVRRPSIDLLEVKLSFLDKRPGCADSTWRVFYVDPQTLEVVEGRMPDGDGELYELRGFYDRALGEFARPIAAATLTQSALHFGFDGQCDLAREALPIFESAYQQLRRETGQILQRNPSLPPLSDGDFAATRDASLPEDTALIRLRFEPSSMSKRHLSATIELVYKKAKQYVLHAMVVVDERQLAGCAPGRPGKAQGAPAENGNGGDNGKPADMAQKDCPVCPELIALPAGEVTIGSPDAEPGRSADEGPMAIRQIRAIAVSRAEVTLAEFEAFLAETGHVPGATSGNAMSQCSAPNSADKWTRSPSRSPRQPGFPQTADDPVVCVTWYDAKAYAQWLSGKTGKPYRLLSEAEFEYMARAGTRSPYWWGEIVDPRLANYKLALDKTSLGPRGTAPKAALPANPWGFLHVSGNAAEWVEDCWNERHAAMAGPGEARLSGDCTRRTIRGGGWTYEPKAIRPAARDNARAEEAFVDVGLRVARDVTN